MNDELFPVELSENVKVFHDSLSQVERLIDATIKDKTKEDFVLDSLGKAKVDVATAFALDSLVWMYMKTNGINPKETEVVSEIQRAKSAMNRIKEVTNNTKRIKVDSEAVKRIVNNSLWEPKASGNKKVRKNKKFHGRKKH